MTLFIMFIFIVLLCLAVPIGLSVGITSLLPSLLTDSFTAGGVFITRSMLGGVNQTTLLAIPLFVLSGIIYILVLDRISLFICRKHFYR